MADHDFQFTSLGRTSMYRATRTAVLGSIFPRSPLHFENAAKSKTKQLLGIWRQRVEELRQEGWAPVFSVRGQYTRNCPPSFVFASDGKKRYLQPCGKWRICPWCWGREVVEDAWKRFYPHFFDERDGDRRPLRRCRLARTTLEDNLPWKMPATRVYGYIMAQLELVSRFVPKNALGAYHVSVIYPNAETERWQCETRSLVLLPSEASVWPRNVSPAPDWTETGILTTRKAIVAEIAKFGAYPREMLFAPPEQVIELLSTKKPFTSKRCSGVLRKKSPQEVEDVEVLEGDRVA